MTEISFKNLSKKYPDGKWALKAFDLEVKKGEFFCLVGPSGCGKSTVLKLIAGLEYATGGEIQRPENVSMVFQSGALFPWLTVFENVAFGLRMQGKPNRVVSEIVYKYLRMVDLPHFSQKYPRELSGGQRQRVGIARALAVEPQVLLLDEPFSALDPLNTGQLHDYLLKIWKSLKITIVMVSHLIEEAVVLADRVGVMKIGNLAGIVEVNLPRPRKEDSKQFSDTVQQISQLGF